MSRQLKAGDRVTLKNTRDGVVERNAATGEDTRVSDREADFDLRRDAQGQESFSQVGKRAERCTPQDRSATRRQPYANQPGTASNAQASVAQGSGIQPPSPPADAETKQTGPTSASATEPPDAPTEIRPATDAPRTATLPGNIPAKAPGTKPTPLSKTAAKADAAAQSKLSAEKSGPPAQNNRKGGKLRFTQGEAALDTPKIHHNRKLDRAQAQLERAAGKLDKARGSLPAKRTLNRVSVTDEKSGAVKRKLRFESAPISQSEHIKGAKPLRPVKAAGNAAIVNAHRKIYQAEHDNVGVKAAHRSEMVVEGGVRTALRHHKAAPYRRVAKLERATRNKSINLTYRRALAENPKMKSNILTRAMQKRKIKKDYAKAAREAKKAAQNAKKAGSTTVKAGKAVLGAVKRHPLAAGAVILIGLLGYTLMSLVGSFSGIGSGSIGAVVASTYLAEDAEMLGAEAAYAGMESDLQYTLDNYEALNPGYDEYVYELDDIWHDPYVLISIISAFYEGAWTLDEVQVTLESLFEYQYTLTETVTKEVRYRTVTTTVTDPVTNETTKKTSKVAYDYYICTVTLENANLSHLPVYIMSEASLSRYALFMSTLGNRPDLFPTYQYPNASTYKEYGKHEIPPEYFEDETFAAIIYEAEKYLGMPYVWGGSKPQTSFDCSGFVSWVLNQSGWDIGRLGAKALYNIGTPVSASEAKPGDLIFFHSTYKTPTPGISHVGIYVGDGMMIHCGNPIGYVSVETPYWQAHFYGYARIY